MGGGICKSVITQSKCRRLIVKLLNPLCPLDVDPVAQIEVCTVCTERLVCTKYISKIKMHMVFQGELDVKGYNMNLKICLDFNS